MSARDTKCIEFTRKAKASGGAGKQVVNVVLMQHGDH